MTAKEAIWRLKDHFRVHDDGVPTPYLDEAAEMAYKALEARIPKKVIITQWKYAECPTCGCILSEHLGDGYIKHYDHLEVCPNAECCQRLDWQVIV